PGTRRTFRRDARGAMRVLGKVQHIRRTQRPGLTTETSQAIFDIGRVTDLPGLAVIDDIDSTLDLFSHHVAYRLLHFLLESGLVPQLALVLRVQHRHQFIRSRQTASVSRENTVSATFHNGTLFFRFFWILFSAFYLPGLTYLHTSARVFPEMRQYLPSRHLFA